MTIGNSPVLQAIRPLAVHRRHWPHVRVESGLGPAAVQPSMGVSIS
jgi:hypothetical protein